MATRTPLVPTLWRVRPHTYLSFERLRAVQDHVRHVTEHSVPGAFMECGVAAGGSALLLALERRRRDPERALWLFDTFEGLPPPTENDPDYAEAMQWAGLCRGELADVQRLLRDNGIASDSIHWIKGLYQDTMPTVTLPPIAVLHLDSDWYDPTLFCLQQLWPRLSRGGRLQLDDYGTWQGCHQAVHDYFGAALPTLHQIDGVGVWIEKTT